MSGGDAPGSKEKGPDSQAADPKSATATETPAGQTKGWPSVVENLKGVGMVLGSLGSVAALFYWIGYAVIMSRLRVYDLYGIVRYTDEYVTEAGYQFFLDHLTFYQEPWTVPVMLAVIIALFVAMPWGPFPRQLRSVEIQAPRSARIRHWPQRAYFILRNPYVGYLVFVALALASVVVITADLPLSLFRRQIDRQEKRLVEIQGVLDNAVLVFGPLPEQERSGDPALRNRFDNFIRGESLEPGSSGREWVSQSMNSLARVYPDVLKKTSMEEMLTAFQKELDIPDEGPEILDKDFTRSVTYDALRGLRVNEKINRELERRTKIALAYLRHLRDAIPDGETDFFTIVRYTRYFRLANEALRDLADLRGTIGVSFGPRTTETMKAWKRLEGVRPIRFGQFLLSCSFWVLVGILVYLVLNSPQLLKFAHWELLYFVALLMLFLTLAVSLPTAYGKYRFDFKMLKLVDMAFREDQTRRGEVGRKIEELRKQNANLYILGSTKGNEVLIGAISAEKAPQIVIFERDAFTLVTVEPPRADDVLYDQIGQLLATAP